MSWAEIKHAVNSTLGTTGFKPLNKQLDDVNASVSDCLTTIGTSSSTGTATLFGFLKRGGIKSIQRGQITTNDTEYTVTISTVTLAKSALFINTRCSALNVTDAGLWTASAVLTGSSIKISKRGSSNTTIAWQVIEFY